MNYLLIGLASLFGFLSAILALLLGVTFTKAELSRYPLLKWVHSHKVTLVGVVAIFLVIAGVTGTWGTLITSGPSLETILGPGGETEVKATSEGFRKEAEETASELVDVAEDYFNAAEKDFEARQYQDAARNYQKSIDELPTMSGYLNLGLSLLNISAFPQAQDAFISGLQTARRKEHLAFEGAFLGNIGLVYFGQGRLEEALTSYQAALTIYQEIGNPLGEAAAGLNNIGVVYFGQGRLEEALEHFEEAHAIFLQMGAKLHLGLVEDNIELLHSMTGEHR